MCNLFNAKQKKISLYVVVPNLQDEITDLKDVVLLTIAATKEDCEEYINKRLFIENKSHYKSWCELRDYDFEEEAPWKEYSEGGIVDLEKYLIFKVQYKLGDIATIFRMFNGCIPIGTSYEDDFELLNFVNALPQDTVEKIVEEAQKLEEDSN